MHRLESPSRAPTGSTHPHPSIFRQRPLRAALLVLVFLACWSGPPAGGAEPHDLEGLLKTWFAKQATIQCWAADVTQIRELRAVAHPLRTSGKVWYCRPGRFRWQLGEPPRTIAIRTAQELLVIYPRLQQVERYPQAEAADPAWKQALALIEAGFPQTAEAFSRTYERTGATLTDGRCRLELRPAAREARRLIEQVVIEIATETHLLTATELVFPDGSRMRNEFANHQLNPDLPPTLFEADIPAGYTVVHPLQRGP